MEQQDNNSIVSKSYPNPNSYCFTAYLSFSRQSLKTLDKFAGRKSFWIGVETCQYVAKKITNTLKSATLDKNSSEKCELCA